MPDAQILGDELPDPFKLGMLRQIKANHQSLAASIRSPSVGRVAQAFSSNLDRPGHLALCLPFLCIRATVRERIQCEAQVAVTGELKRATLADFSDIEQSALLGVSQHRANELDEERMAASGDHLNPITNSLWPAGVYVLNELLSQDAQNHPVRNSVEAVLSSVVIGAWTAFEVGAADLWELTLNERPALGLAMLRDAILQEGGNTVQDDDRDVRHPVSLRLLEKYDFNLRDRMGTLLREKWTFSRKSEIREAYRKTFGKKCDEINAIFDDQQLTLLSVLRNVIVHNAGVADGEFVRRSKSHPQLSTVSEGKKIHLDGELIHPFLEVVSQRGIELFKFVDSWMSSNPVKPRH